MLILDEVHERSRHTPYMKYHEIIDALTIDLHLPLDRFFNSDFPSSGHGGHGTTLRSQVAPALGGAPRGTAGSILNHEKNTKKNNTNNRSKNKNAKTNNQARGVLYVRWGRLARISKLQDVASPSRPSARAHEAQGGDLVVRDSVLRHQPGDLRQSERRRTIQWQLLLFHRYMAMI